MMLFQRCLHRRQRVSLAIARLDASICKPLVRWQSLVKIDDILEESGYLFRGFVIRVAIGVEGRDAGAVFVPFVSPEAIGGTLIGDPVGVHVGEE